MTTAARCAALAAAFAPEGEAAEPVRILDVGANPMRHDPPYRALLDAGLAHVTGFEPQPEALAALNAAKGPNETYLPYAIGDGGSHTLHLYHGSGLASLLPIRQRTIGVLRGLRRAARETGRETLETFRLDDIAEVGRVDFFKIDIQGAETLAFDHADTALSECMMVQVEVNFFPLYEDQPPFGEIDLRLRRHGLHPYSFAHIDRRPVLSSRFRGMDKDAAGQMLDGDAIYLRDISGIDGMDTPALKRLALLADGVANAPDICCRCLDALEERGEVAAAAIDAWAALVPKG